ncbi:hypothetical protein [Chromobacterium sp. CV08]|uniref:hypothetical protein n=1 Tax=Chromobacterium sp. CV08 TaxID=3133274 RepID=UPI003DA9FE92
MKNFLSLVSVFLLASGVALAKPASHSPSTSSEPQSVESISQDISKLKSVVAEQSSRLERQQASIDLLAKNSGGGNTLWAAFAVVIAAFLGGVFAIRNQNKQAEQERLLKAVELIMNSNSAHQADIRRGNLASFLDDATNAHLENIKNEFSGSEFTDLHLALAQAMSEKVATPREVLDIWQRVLKGKKFFDHVEYP